MSGLSYTADHPATAYTNAASVIAQIVAAAGVGFTLKRIELQSNQTSAGQAIAVVQLGSYATPHASGTSGTIRPINRRNTVSPASAFRYASATLGTTFTPWKTWQWNIALPFEQQFGDEDLEFEIAGGGNCALLLTAGIGTPTLSASLDIVEH